MRRVRVSIGGAEGYDLKNERYPLVYLTNPLGHDPSALDNIHTWTNTNLPPVPASYNHFDGRLNPMWTCHCLGQR